MKHCLKLFFSLRKKNVKIPNKLNNQHISSHYMTQSLSHLSEIHCAMTRVIFFITTAQKNTQKYFIPWRQIVIHSRFSSVQFSICLHVLYVRYCVLYWIVDWTERITAFRYDTQLKHTRVNNLVYMRLM